MAASQATPSAGATPTMNSDGLPSPTPRSSGIPRASRPSRARLQAHRTSSDAISSHVRSPSSPAATSARIPVSGEVAMPRSRVPDPTSPRSSDIVAKGTNFSRSHSVNHRPAQPSTLTRNARNNRPLSDTLSSKRMSGGATATTEPSSNTAKPTNSPSSGTFSGIRNLIRSHSRSRRTSHSTSALDLSQTETRPSTGSGAGPNKGVWASVKSAPQRVRTLSASSSRSTPRTRSAAGTSASSTSLAAPVPAFASTSSLAPASRIEADFNASSHMLPSAGKPPEEPGAASLFSPKQASASSLNVRSPSAANSTILHAKPTFAPPSSDTTADSRDGFIRLPLASATLTGPAAPMTSSPVVPPPPIPSTLGMGTSSSSATTEELEQARSTVLPSAGGSSAGNDHLLPIAPEASEHRTTFPQASSVANDSNLNAFRSELGSSLAAPGPKPQSSLALAGASSATKSSDSPPSFFLCGAGQGTELIRGNPGLYSSEDLTLGQGYALSPDLKGPANASAGDSEDNPKGNSQRARTSVSERHRSLVCAGSSSSTPRTSSRSLSLSAQPTGGATPSAHSSFTPPLMEQRGQQQDNLYERALPGLAREPKPPQGLSMTPVASQQGTSYPSATPPPPYTLRPGTATPDYYRSLGLSGLSHPGQAPVRMDAIAQGLTRSAQPNAQPRTQPHNSFTPAETPQLAVPRASPHDCAAPNHATSHETTAIPFRMAPSSSQSTSPLADNNLSYAREGGALGLSLPHEPSKSRNTDGDTPQKTKGIDMTSAAVPPYPSDSNREETRAPRPASAVGDLRDAGEVSVADIETHLSLIEAALENNSVDGSFDATLLRNLSSGPSASGLAGGEDLRLSRSSRSLSSHPQATFGMSQGPQPKSSHDFPAVSRSQRSTESLIVPDAVGSIRPNSETEVRGMHFAPQSSQALSAAVRAVRQALQGEHLTSARAEGNRDVDREDLVDQDEHTCVQGSGSSVPNMRDVEEAYERMLSIVVAATSEDPFLPSTPGLCAPPFQLAFPQPPARQRSTKRSYQTSSQPSIQSATQPNPQSAVQTTPQAQCWTAKLNSKADQAHRPDSNQTAADALTRGTQATSADRSTDCTDPMVASSTLPTTESGSDDNLAPVGAGSKDRLRAVAAWGNHSVHPSQGSSFGTSQSDTPSALSHESQRNLPQTHANHPAQEVQYPRLSDDYTTAVEPERSSDIASDSETELSDTPRKKSISSLAARRHIRIPRGAFSPSGRSTEHDRSSSHRGPERSNYHRGVLRSSSSISTVGAGAQRTEVSHPAWLKAGTRTEAGDCSGLANDHNAATGFRGLINSSSLLLQEDRERRHRLETESLLDAIERAEQAASQAQNEADTLRSDLHTEVARVLQLERALEQAHSRGDELEYQQSRLEEELQAEHQVTEKLMRQLEHLTSFCSKTGMNHRMEAGQVHGSQVQNNSIDNSNHALLEGECAIPCIKGRAGQKSVAHLVGLLSPPTNSDLATCLSPTEGERGSSGAEVRKRSAPRELSSSPLLDTQMPIVPILDDEEEQFVLPRAVRPPSSCPLSTDQHIELSREGEFPVPASSARSSRKPPPTLPHPGGSTPHVNPPYSGLGRGNPSAQAHDRSSSSSLRKVSASTQAESSFTARTLSSTGGCYLFDRSERPDRTQRLYSGSRRDRYSALEPPAVFREIFDTSLEDDIPSGRA